MMQKRSSRLRFSRFAIILALIASATGCGGPSRLELHPAKGTVLQAGKPAIGARVTLYPSASIVDEQAKALRPNGTVDGTGAYALSTYVPNDGAPAGEWVVTIVWPDPKVDEKTRKQLEEEGNSVPDVFRGRFAKPENSPWKVKIAEGENSLPPIDLSKP
jgi:hypothetical protein